MTWLYFLTGVLAFGLVVTVYLLARLRGQYNDMRDRNNQACRDNAGLRDKLARTIGELAIEKARIEGLMAANTVLREERNSLARGTLDALNMDEQTRKTLRDLAEGKG